MDDIKTEDTLNICRICGKACSTKIGRQVHERSHERSGEIRFTGQKLDGEYVYEKLEEGFIQVGEKPAKKQKVIVDKDSINVSEEDAQEHMAQQVKDEMAAGVTLLKAATMFRFAILIERVGPEAALAGIENLLNMRNG